MKFYTLIAATMLFCQLVNAQGYTLRGIVTDRTDNSPLIGATVSVADSNLNVRTQTNINGEYRISDLNKNQYVISVSFIGYQTIQDTISLNDSTLSLNYALKSQDSEIHEIVVTGTGTEHYLKDAPVQTEVISGKVLKEYSGRNIEDILSGLSSSITFSPNDMGSNIQMNGLKNDYILILIDGRKINGEIGGQNDLNRINMDNIDRIEIVKGAASSLYGSDAIGGVINFISKKDRDKFSISNTSRVGQHADVNQANSVTWNRGKLTSSVSSVLRHTDGWQNTTQEWHRGKLFENSVTRTVNRSTNYTISGDITYKMNKNLELKADASYYEKWTDRPTGNPLWRLNGFYYRNQDYATGAKYYLPNKNTVTLDVSYGRYDYSYDYTGQNNTDYFDANGDRIIYFSGDRILQSSQRRWMVNLKGIFHLGSQNTLNVGIEDIYEKLISPYRLEGDRASTYSVSRYVQDEWNPTKAMNITAGIRLVNNKEFGYSASPKISTKYKLGNFNMRATYSNGYKAPTTKELYYHYYATLMSKYKAYYGNTDLKPQKSNYFAANIEYIVPKFKVSVTTYHNRINNMISLQSTETSFEDKLLLVEETMKYVNLSKARTYGIDMTFEGQLPLNFRLGGSYSYLDAKAQRTDDEEADNYLQYVHINSTSRHSASFKASWIYSWSKYKLGAYLNGRYQSKRFYTSDGNAKGFQIWRLNTSHSLLNKTRVKFDLNVGIDNIFNYVDRTPFGHNRGTTSPGRNYYTSVIIKFQNNTK